MSSAKQQDHSLSRKFIAAILLVHNNFYRQTAVPIPFNQFCVLCTLTDGIVLSIKDISVLLKISKQQMTTVIEKLVASGYVEKHPDPADRRSFLISITQKGQSLLVNQREVIRRNFEDRLSHLDAQEIETFSSSLDNFNRSIEKMFMEPND